MLKFLKYISEHVFEIIGIVIVLGGAAVIAFMRSIRELIVEFVSQSYSGWIATGVTVLIILTYMVYVAFFKSRPKTMLHVIKGQPRHILWEAVSDLLDVKWRFYVGTDNFLSYTDIERMPDRDLRGFVEGPYCKQCDYELDFSKKSNKWTCVAGHKPVTIPKDFRENTKDKVTKILEANFREKRQSGELK